MPSAKLLHLTLALTSLAASGCAQYSVRRAALVPQPTPTMRTGQPMDRVAELGLGMGTVARLAEPREGDSDAGLHIPRVQVAGNLRFRPTRNFDLGLIMERAFVGGSTSLADDQPTPEGGDARAFGTSLYYSAATRDAGFRLGISADFLIYSIPHVEYRTCVENCDHVKYTDVVQKRSGVPVVSLGLTPSWHHKGWTGFGGVTFRNHPTIEKGGTEGFYDTDDLEAGPMNAIISAGVEYHIDSGVRAGLVVHHIIAQDPVSYAPTIAATVTIPLSQPRKQ
jgi:hypothetical protein